MKDPTFVSDTIHVSLKIKGDQEHVNLFHEILRRCDPSWPWKSGMFLRVQQCDKCKGLLFTNPRINAADIKAAAKQAGVKKVTIVRFGPSSKCYTENERYTKTRWIDADDAHTLYRSQMWLEMNQPKVVMLPTPKDEAAGTAVTTDKPTRDGGRTHIIFPDGTCDCICHERPMHPHFTHNSGAGCCSKVWQPRECPVRPPLAEPAIVSAVAVVTPDGSIIDAGAPEDVDVEIGIPASERRLMDQIVEAEREAASAEPGMNAGDLPWGSGWLN